MATTLQGLFETKPRCHRNFLLENKRDVKAKSKTNSQRNETSLEHTQRQHISLNSLHSLRTSSTKQAHPASKERSKGSDSHETKAKPAQLPRKDSAINDQFSKTKFKSKRSHQTIPPSSNHKAVNYIHQENVPFEWTEVCPSLISHRICHQGVQTEDASFGTLVQKFRQFGSEDLIAAITESNTVVEGMKEGKVHESASPSEICGSDTKNQLAQTKAIADAAPFKSNKKDSLMDVCGTSAHTATATKSSPQDLVANSSKSETSKKSSSNIRTGNDHQYYPSSYQMGVIPTYLSKRKTEQASASARAQDFDPTCPPGHVVMSDNERKETLNMILKNYNDLIKELNKIPVRTDTLKMKHRKIEIEKQLDKLEEGIRVFSRSKVYVKLDS